MRKKRSKKSNTATNIKRAVSARKCLQRQTQKQQQKRSHALLASILRQLQQITTVVAYDEKRQGYTPDQGTISRLKLSSSPILRRAISTILSPGSIPSRQNYLG